MFTNCGSFNEGAVISGKNNETDAILIRLKGIQIRWSTMQHKQVTLFIFTNCGSFNEGAVVSGNIDETSIIRCN